MRLNDLRPSHVGFGFSPARESLRGIAVILHPAQHAEQTPWLREARRRLPRALRRRMEHFRFFFEPSTEVFPRLWDPLGRRSFDSEISALRSNLPLYREAVVRRLCGKRFIDITEIRRLSQRSWYEPAAAEYARHQPNARAMLEQFVESPAQSLRAFSKLLEEFHANVFVPGWEPIDARLRADIGMRERVLRDYGIGALLRTLGADIIVHRTRAGAAIETMHGEMEIDLTARDSIALTPSFFCWPGHEMFILREPRAVRCIIAYPVPPLTVNAATIERRDAVAAACAALADPLRLRILELLNARDLSTRELAGFLKLDDAVVSRHLRLLFEASLVQRRRNGYFVMYSLRRDSVRMLTGRLSALYDRS